MKGFSEEFKFAGSLCSGNPGDHIDTNEDIYGRFFRATLDRDEFSEEPWNASDLHGIVSNWRPIESQLPGERVICRDGYDARFYNIDATIQKAKDEDWGVADPAGLTPEQIAEKATEDDYEVCRQWLEDQWYYGYIVISLHQRIGDDTVLLKDGLASCGGIEVDYPGSDNSYLGTVANECLSEALQESASHRCVTYV